MKRIVFNVRPAILKGGMFMKTLARKTTTANRARFAARAKEVMTPNPLSIGERATLREAALFLTSKDISAAPVINEAGRPVGVISLADIVRCVHASEVSDTRLPLTVREVMTPVVYFVRPDTPVANVMEDLLDCAVHRLFVVDDDEVLIGVISTLDLLQHLRGAHPGDTHATFEGTRRPRRVLRSRSERSAKDSTSGSDIVMAGTSR
jgi:CBS domain-containing protein